MKFNWFDKLLLLIFAICIFILCITFYVNGYSILPPEPQP